MNVEKISRAKEYFVKAVATGEVSYLSEVYDNNAEIFLEGGVIIRGIEEISNKIKNFLDLIGPSDIDLQTVDFWEHGDVMYENGIFYLKKSENEKLYSKGCYVLIWKVQRDGTYKIYREIKMDLAV